MKNLDNISIDKAEKIVDKESGVTGLEISYLNDKGDKKKIVMDDYDDARKKCSDCGRPRYKCMIERNESVKHPQDRDKGSKSRAKGEQRERSDVSSNLEF